MFKSLTPLTIDSSTAWPLIDPALLKTVSPTANNYETASGYALLLVTTGRLYLGGADVVSTRASYLEAGQITLTLRDDEIPYAIAPTGQTVTVQRFAQGLKDSNDPAGFGQGGFGAGGFGV